jgi:hypothetical protein
MYCCLKVKFSRLNAAKDFKNKRKIHATGSVSCPHFFAMAIIWPGELSFDDVMWPNGARQR